MKKPEMILFDYGHTLVYEPVFDRTAGFRAVLSRCTSVPRSVTAERLDELYAAALDRLMAASRAAGCDFYDSAVKRLLYEREGLIFTVGDVELERIFWDAAGPGAPMPGIRELLTELRCRGIRSGVVSNMNFREENLRERVCRLLPENDFEFILASCEYATRKPRAEYFALALRKAGLRPEQVWFCGDNPRCDVLGAAEAGLFPVWYRNETLPCPYRSAADLTDVECQHLRIRDWVELLRALDGCES